METFKIIILIVGGALLALSVFFTVEEDCLRRKDREIPNLVKFNWARLWFVYAVITGTFLLIFY